MQEQNKTAEQQTVSVDFPVDFQREIINLVRNLFAVSAARFGLVNPHFLIKGYVSYNVGAETEKLYQSRYSHLDPMHPSRFKDSDETVICSDTMMSETEWRQSEFYQQFMGARHFDHDADVFFRQNGEIIAVLSLLRDDSLGRFTEAELTRLQHLQPFMEYTLNRVYKPKRFSERDLFSDKYALTERELDVMEIVMDGADTRTMATELNLSVATVKTHLQHIFEKVGVHSTKELISKLYRELSVDT